MSLFFKMAIIFLEVKRSGNATEFYFPRISAPSVHFAYLTDTYYLPLCEDYNVCFTSTSS